MARLHGIILPSSTPFIADGEIDFVAARAQVRWMLGQGVYGIAAGGSAGEGHTLDADEFRRLIAAMGEEGGARKANSRGG